MRDIRMNKGENSDEDQSGHGSTDHGQHAGEGDGPFDPQAQDQGRQYGGRPNAVTF